MTHQCLSDMTHTINTVQMCLGMCMYNHSLMLLQCASSQGHRVSGEQQGVCWGI